MPFYAGTTWAFLGLFKKKEEPLSEMDQVKAVVIEGIKASQKGDVEAAGEAFHNALKMSSEFYKEEKITKQQFENHRVFIFDQLANLNLEIGNLKEAEALFIETMKMALNLGMPTNHNAMIEMMLKVATIHLYTGRMETGVIGLRDVIAEQEKKLADPPPKPETEGEEDPEEEEKRRVEEENTKVLLGKAYRHYAKYYMQLQLFKNAKEMTMKALEMAKATLGLEHDQTFVIMNDLAIQHIMLKEYDLAEKTLKEGLKLGKKADSIMQAALYTNLGLLYMRMSKLAEAETACKKGLWIAERGDDKYLIRPCQACLEELAQLKQGKGGDKDKAK